jgi:hypothetical protein
MRALTFRVLLLAMSAAIFLGTGEAALRIIYRDRGRTTLSGPGGYRFEHLSRDETQRARLDYGAKRPGVPRVMVLGDSITWGEGVRDWRDTWTEQLAMSLERAGKPHEFAVLAGSGRDVYHHVQEMNQWLPDVRPDIVIYQWYVNDLEVLEHRPLNQRWWQKLPTHESLRQSSFLYFFLNDRFTKFLPPPDRSYVQYILDDFIPGTLEWAEFERFFHALAVRAHEASPRRIMLIYPQVPHAEPPPLQPVHERLRAMATQPHRLSIPPAAWGRWAGTPGIQDGTRWRHVIDVPRGTKGPIAETRDYYLTPRTNELKIGVASDEAASGYVELIDAETNQVMATLPWTMPAPAAQEIALRLPLESNYDVRFRVGSSGSAAFALTAIELPVNYGFEVLDLSGPLNTFDTHASIFDAHPNERAHRVIADHLLEMLTKK